MKAATSILFILFCLLFGPASAQHSSSWKEMDAFHDVMSETFHPSEDGNLKPIKSRIDEMIEKAKAWRKSAVPEKYDAAKTAPRLKSLVKGAEALRKTIRKGATDEVITSELSKLHDVFHDIMENGRK